MEANFFVSDSELTSYINNSLAELYGILTCDYEEYNLYNFISTLPNDGVSNTIPVPSNFWKLRGVDYQNLGQGSPQWYTLFPFQFPERNQSNNILNNIVSPWGKLKLSYRVADTGILIQPMTQAQGVYQVWYTPKFQQLTISSDLLTIQMDTQAWVEYAIVDCCIKIFNKQNLDPTGFMAEKEQLKLRIRAEAKNRDSAGPKRVANVRYQNDDMCIPFMYDYY